ncbi:MAG: lipopolysaccharide biosynthesis protein [Desulfuromonadales bacterium]|nr:lipopolysaccharide biosynthesis protein [Desulfuromonadales bacterium]
MQHKDNPELSCQLPSLDPDVPLLPQNTSSCLLDYLEMLIIRSKFVIGITVVATILAVIYAFTLPNIYTAKAKILPPQGGSGLLSSAMMQGALAAAVGGGGDFGGLTDSKSAKLYSELLKIESLRDPIIERFNLQGVYKKKYREDVYKTMLKMIAIQSGKEGIISISVDDKDPKRAAGIANALIDELKKLTTQMSVTGANNSKAFLEERIVKAREDLALAENNLKFFQGKYKTLDATQQASVSVNAISQLTAQLTNQEIQLGILRRTYADSSQEIKSLQQSIAVLKGKIANLQSSGGGSLPGFEKIPERGQEYLHLMRTFKTAEAVHDMLVRQYEVSKLNAENDVSTIQVIQKALVPERKSKPARLKLILSAFFIGLLMSSIWVLIFENISPAIRCRLSGIFRHQLERK